MFIRAARARREILRMFTFQSIHPAPETRRAIKLAVDRDLQARILPPNTPVPPRRRILRYLKAVQAATGSWRTALLSLPHGGAWTSSGGSFRLADMIGIDMYDLCDTALTRQGRLTYLEVGAGWAGFARNDQRVDIDGVAGLAKRYHSNLGDHVALHFTNITRWHGTSGLPTGVSEHPFITAACLGALEARGVPPNSVDVLYSQAAAYFEPDQARFLQTVARLLRDDGVLLYNFQDEMSDVVLSTADRLGLVCDAHVHVGGMNGEIALFRKQDAADIVATPQQDRPTDSQAWLTAAE
ncbi:methyltransferase domain-containing protein [Pelagibius sp.]|uniref:methyltransferase domain-containing protein n=1 Tax=Pelagibius sp. TaxID=1931238 RepID=UPI003BAE6947